MSNPEKAGTPWFSENHRTLRIIAIVIFLGFPLVYLAITSSNAPPIAIPPRTDNYVPAMEKVANDQPTAQNFLNLSLAYYKANRFNDCVLAARRAASMKPDYAEAYNNMAAGFIALSMWDSAIPAAAEAVRLSPDFQLAKDNLARAKQGSADVKQEIANQEKIVHDAPTAENYLALSAEYFQDMQYESSIKAARKALALKPDFAGAYNNICAAYNSLGNFADGKKAGEEAVRLDPANQLYKNNLKWANDELSKK